MGFLDATRQQFMELEGKAYSSGNKLSWQLPSVGILAGIHLHLTGTATLTDSANTATLTGPQHSRGFNIMQRVKLKANSTPDIVDLSGKGLYMQNLVSTRRWNGDLAPATTEEARGFSAVYQFATTASSGGTANTWEWMLRIPVAINYRDPIGALLLGTDRSVYTLDITCEAIANLFGSGTPDTAAFTGTITPILEIFSIPDDERDWPDFSLVHTMLEHRTPISSTGDNPVKLERGNIYTRIMHDIILNDSPAGVTDVASLSLKYNQNIPVVDTITGRMWQALQRERYGMDLPQGMYVHDLTFQGWPSYGNHRDFINSAAVTQLQSHINIASGATLGSGNNWVDTIREQLVPLRMN